MAQIVKRLVAFLGFLFLGLSAAHSAIGDPAVYNFSYTFENGKVATGSFTGTASGNLVTGLSSISVTFDGTPFSGNGILDPGSRAPGHWIGTGAVASFDGTKNNFRFRNGSEGTNEFYAVNIHSALTDDAAVVLGQQVPAWDSLYVGTTYSAARWHLAVAAPVPEPGPVVLWGAGLAGLIALRRRRFI